MFSNSCCGNDHNIILFFFWGLNSCRVKPLGQEILKIEGMVTQSCLPFWDCSPGCKLSPIVEMCWCGMMLDCTIMSHGILLTCSLHVLHHMDYFVSCTLFEIHMFNCCTCVFSHLFDLTKGYMIMGTLY